MKDNKVYRAFLLGGVILVLTFFIASGLYKNSWGIIEPDFYKHRQRIFEFWVVGRLNLSQHDGIFSGGGLLAIGDGGGYSVDSKVIQHQYDSYSKNERFDDYWLYKSNPAIEGILFSFFDSITDFSPGFNMKLFRLGTSALTALVFAMLILWVFFEFGLLASALLLAFIHFSPWLTLMGGNIYWQLWVFYLPLVIIPALVKNIKADIEFPRWKIEISVFFMAFLKILFTGFEFISTFFIMMTVPFIFYAVNNGWQKSVFFKKMISISVSMLVALASGISVLLMQIANAEKGFLAAIRYIQYAFKRRTFGDSLSFSTIDLIERFIQGPAISYEPFTYETIFSSTQINYALFIFAFIFFSILLVVLILSSRHSVDSKRKWAMLLTTWYSFLAPMSWFIIFKSHAHDHPSLDFIVWQMPFMFFGLALIGFTISLFYKKLFKTKEL
ncbi:MAG: hypothetical protein HN392_11195 [Anaerolineae bacterium]|jgi:hypothetical protein|nr:hypothetical protein [Anaerolineae bacterium]MBT7074668.1 hypothetical protein [Anaerolineae bacterium]MBT7783669.1 hypothetical protein [Anaerolineae bacterium]